MRYLVRAGKGLGDTIIATPIVEALRRTTGNDVYYLVEPRFAFLFANAPYKVTTVVPKLKFDVYVNLGRDDDLEVMANVKMDCNDKLWGLDSNTYVPKLFLTKLKLWNTQVDPTIYPTLHRTSSKPNVIGYNNQSNWDMKCMSPDVERKFIDEMLLVFPTCEIWYMSVNDRKFDGGGYEPDNERVKIVSPTLEEMPKLITDMRLMVTIDSGPLHLATVLNVPTVALFGPSDWRTWCPAGRIVDIRRPGNSQCKVCMRQQKAMSKKIKCDKDVKCMDSYNIGRLAREILVFTNQLAGA